MKFRFLILSGLFFTFLSCEESPTNTDLNEYGYKGAVKSIHATTYFGLEQENGEWVIDESKISNIKTLTFNETGNIVSVETIIPKLNNEVETTFFEFTDDRKSAYFKLNAAKDTTEKGIYTWKSDLEYELVIELASGSRMESTSKLNSNYRDLSGKYQYFNGDSVLYAKSYVNVIDDKGLISTITFTDEITKVKQTMSMTYKDYDSKENPLRIALVDKETGLLENLSIRKYEYFD
ncbi:MAG: hypothetical protein P8P74_06225 [Crocinitomicaceae bacterium]|nr:hypothetical protein [Crocinitomicaceae bacterium]